MPISQKELLGFMESWDGDTRRIIEDRIRNGFRRERLEFFTAEEAAVLKAMLDRMIPQEEGIDLVSFLDWAVGLPLGHGDRREGMPEERELFKKGIAGVDGAARDSFDQGFVALTPEMQDRLLTDIQKGKAEGEAWGGVPPSYFFSSLLAKALIGYCSHPSAWLRMGFPGASYPEGYLWITGMEINSRSKHVPGWKRF